MLQQHNFQPNKDQVHYLRSKVYLCRRELFPNFLLFKYNDFINIITNFKTCYIRKQYFSFYANYHKVIQQFDHVVLCATTFLKDEIPLLGYDRQIHKAKDQLGTPIFGFLVLLNRSTENQT